jgi:anaerobic ribonucleoside-triphosphate reductase activating protein
MKITNLYKNCAYGDVQLDISFAGCEHRCKGCYVPELQDATMFPDWTPEYIYREIEKEARFVKGFVLLGGDPLHPNNTEDAITLIRHLKATYDKPVTMLTGYTPEEVARSERRTLATKLCDKVLMGRYTGGQKQLDIGKPEREVWQ